MKSDISKVFLYDISFEDVCNYGYVPLNYFGTFVIRIEQQHGVSVPWKPRNNWSHGCCIMARSEYITIFDPEESRLLNVFKFYKCQTVLLKTKLFRRTISFNKIPI